MTAHLVSVVIPAFNAAHTLDETLRSVRSQTHTNMEIVIVDDGSNDETRSIADGHAADDSRIRVFSQTNAGVAAARNAGTRYSKAAFIAFIDADDLWAPTKIEQQLEAMIAGGDKVGLVYTWFRQIDAQGRVIGEGPRPACAGNVLENICAGNFVGNGSSAFVRRCALEDVEGFDSGLREANAEGCEDFLLYCRIAEKYDFAVVPAFLVGYRYSPDSMSGDLPRMLKSWVLAAQAMQARRPTLKDALSWGLSNYGSWLMCRAAMTGKLNYFLSILFILKGPRVAVPPRLLLRRFLGDFRHVLKGRLAALFSRPSVTESPRFQIGCLYDAAQSGGWSRASQVACVKTRSHLSDSLTQEAGFGPMSSKGATVGNSRAGIPAKLEMSGTCVRPHDRRAPASIAGTGL
jgi:glycosyltransferase involved in cell wall biosynthesis